MNDPRLHVLTDLYWFAPPQLQRGPARAACPWRHRFTLTIVRGFASRG